MSRLSNTDNLCSQPPGNAAAAAASTNLVVSMGSSAASIVSGGESKSDGNNGGSKSDHNSKEQQSQESYGAKRRRISNDIGDTSDISSSSAITAQHSQCEQLSLHDLCLESRWIEAAQRAAAHPEEASRWNTNRSSDGGTGKPPLPTSSPAGHRHKRKSSIGNMSSPLAIACRHSAPYGCIKAILEASPEQLRVCKPTYGTPLHEALASNTLRSSDVIKLLVETDEQLSHRNSSRDINESSNNDSMSSSKRATLMQDIDGYTPLHILIRRQFHLFLIDDDGSGARDSSNNNEKESTDDGAVRKTNRRTEDELMIMLKTLVQSSPESVGISDKGEYEETPLVMALKASVYASPYDNRVGGGWRSSSASESLNNIQIDVTTATSHEENTTKSNDTTSSENEYGNQNYRFFIRMEKTIFDIIKIMLTEYSDAASLVMSSDRGNYTALHSAAFHGRCSNTIELLLKAELMTYNRKNNKPISSTALLLQNSSINRRIYNDSYTSLLLLSSPSADASSLIYSRAALLCNEQGELPLHFATMRGESTNTVLLLSNASPRAVLKRDNKGLTPFHWLWIRYVSTLSRIVDNKSNTDFNSDINDEKIRESGEVRERCEASTGKVKSKVPMERRRSTRQVDRSLIEKKSSVQKQNRFTATREADSMKYYTEFCCLERGDFNTDLKLIRKLDSPLDFFSMRHIPTESLQENGIGITSNHNDENESNRYYRWVPITVETLEEINSRYQQRLRPNQDEMTETVSDNRSDDSNPNIWTRREAVAAFFWTKVVYLLRAAHVAGNMLLSEDKMARNSLDDTVTNSSRHASLNQKQPPNAVPQEQQQAQHYGGFMVVHTAMASPCCPPPVAQMATCLHPEELSIQDSHGKLPLHHAACRAWRCWESTSWVFPENFMWKEESLDVLKIAVRASPSQAARVADFVNERLALHYAIDTFVRALCCGGQSSVSVSSNDSDVLRSDENPVSSMLNVLHQLVRMYPDSLERRDGKTKLYPFLQATSAATLYRSTPPTTAAKSEGTDEMPLSIAYALLRENPSVVTSGI